MTKTLSFVDKLQALMKPEHTLKLTELTEFQDNWNNTTNLSVKHAYNIEITHDDDAYRYWPSSIASSYYTAIKQLFEDEYHGKLYVNGFSECGRDMKIDVMMRIR